VGFVQVPVPEQHVYEIMQWVLFRSQDWTPGAVDEAAERIVAFVAQEGSATRTLFERVARAAMEQEPIRLRDLADELEITTATLTATVDDVNQRVLDGEPVIERRNETAVGIHGQTGQVAFLSMRLDLARRVHAALPRGGDR
jgi:hypothetical protein